MGELSFAEIILIGILAIVLYGKDLPTVARKISKYYTKARRHLMDIKEEIRRQIPEEELDLNRHVAAADPVSPPAPPANLRAVAGEGEITLTWDPAETATRYIVKRRAADMETLQILAGAVPEPRYTDTDLPAGATFHYAVTAANNSGEGVDSGEATATLPDPPISPPPSA